MIGVICGNHDRQTMDHRDDSRYLSRNAMARLLTSLRFAEKRNVLRSHAIVQSPAQIKITNEMHRKTIAIGARA